MGKPGGGASDVEDFAGYLRELKERGDRSFGALARRLNVSASTLHRYCAGEAVPANFALLERFAQLCEASPGERTELHRLWVRALEARRPGAREPEPDSHEPDGHEPDGHEPVGHEPVDVPVDEPGDGASEAGVPKDGGTRAPGGPPAAGGGESGDQEAVGSPAVPTVAVGTAARRRRGVVAVAVAALALVVVTLTGLLVPDGNTGPSEPVAGSPDPEAPLTWTANPHAWQAGCDHRYLVDDQASDVPAPPDEQDAASWAASLDAVHGQDTLVRITVQGRTSAAVVLEALRVRVVDRSDPASGGVFLMNDGCGGALTPRMFDVDLDANRPVATSLAGNDAGTEIPAVTFPYRVSAEEPEVLLVNAHTVDCDCAWYLELEWSSQGRSGTERVDDDGRPFRTSGIEGLPQYGYNWSDGRWERR